MLHIFLIFSNISLFLIAPNPIFDDFWKATCTLCDVTFVRVGNKNIHDQTYHAETFKRYKCSFCDLQSPTVNIILQHHKTIHPNILLPMKSDIRFEEVPNTKKCKWR